MRRGSRAGMGLVLLCICTSGQADVETGIDAEAGLPYWELREPGMSLRLVQRLPDQTRAFFMARGFSRMDVERVARRCVFQTVFRNLSTDTAAGALEYDLRDWTVSGAGTAAESGSRMLIRESWVAEWEQLNVSSAARIAFEWALFPTRQVYHPGDYNWGMAVFDLAPGSRFDLTVVWRQGGARRSARLQNIHCAPDAAQTPETP